MTRLVSLILLGLLLPSIAFAQSVNIGGNVPPRVNALLSSAISAPSSVPADGVTISTVTVTLRDINGDPVPNITAVISSSRGGLDSIGYYVGLTLVSGNSYTSDAFGVVKFGVRSLIPGESTLTAVAQSTVILASQPKVTFLSVPGPIVPPVTPEPPQPSPPDTVIGRIIETVDRAVEEVVKFVRENTNETTNRALASITAVTTATLLPTLTNSVVSAVLQNVSLLNFLFTSWLPIRRRHRWGTIRDKKTSVPVAGVEVQLWQSGSDKAIAKYRTDQTGQYGFLVDKPGEYLLTIENQLYYPYKSDTFLIKDTDEVVSMDIALSPNEAEQAAQMSRARIYMDWVYYFNYISVILMSVGTIVSIYIFYVEPTLLSGAILGFYALIWGFKLYFYLRYRHYGQVVDSSDNSPISKAIVQLTGERQGIQALIHSTISDARGRFLFIVKPAKYSMIVAKEGFDPAETEASDTKLSSTVRLSKSSPSTETIEQSAVI